MKKNRTHCCKEKKQSNEADVTSRRTFMKKAAYTAPKIIALGLLSQGRPASGFPLDQGPPDAPANSGQPW